MKQFTIECSSALSVGDIFENLQRLYPQMIFSVSDNSAQHLRAVDETTCACKDESFINDETPGCCGNCGKPFRH